MDSIPKIVKAAQVHPFVTVSHPRPERMAKELRKHLPTHIITVESGTVMISRPGTRGCSHGTVCTGKP